MIVSIDEEALAGIEAAAKAAAPAEACGLLSGSHPAQGVIAVAEIHPSDNLASDSDRRFEIDAALQLRLQRELRAAGLEIVGVYHSHPEGDPMPSAADRDGAAYPGWVWLITGLSGGAAVTRAFLHAEGAGAGGDVRFEEIRIERGR